MTSVYVHLPFCRARCNYCAFAISTRTDLDSPYTDALVREIRERGERSAVETLYFGGGTPSRTPIRELEKIMRVLHSELDLSRVQEITLEANPEDVDPDTIRAWRELGVDRVSLGVQSFTDAELLSVGRLHGREGALDALDQLSRTDLRISLDLIAGLPGQTDEDFESSLALAVRSAAGHVSIYLLDLEPGSSLEALHRKGALALPDESAVSDRYRLLVQVLTRAGFEQYEVSNFAMPGQRSLHNLRYWNREPYIGLGLGAHSFDGTTRSANTRNMRKYLDATSREERTEYQETLTDEEQRRERIMLAMRRIEGLSHDEFAELTGETGSEWRELGVAEGWLREDRVAFTTEGFIVSDTLISQLF